MRFLIWVDHPYFQGYFQGPRVCDSREQAEFYAAFFAKTFDVPATISVDLDIDTMMPDGKLKPQNRGHQLANLIAEAGLALKEQSLDFRRTCTVCDEELDFEHDCCPDHPDAPIRYEASWEGAGEPE